MFGIRAPTVLVIIFYQVPSIFRPDSTFGSVTETIDKMIEEYVTRELNRIALPIKGAEEFDPEEFRVSDCFECHLSSCIMMTKFLNFCAYSKDLTLN